MKTFISIILTVAISTAVMAQNVYYVSTNGNDAGDGLTIATAWRTITYAASSASPVSPGDSVFIEAGDYGNEYVVFETDGTADNQITFEGYQTVPGDNPDLEWEYGDTLDATIMPLLDGGDRTTGNGITLHSRQYISVNNFQIRNYQAGLYAWHGHNLKIDNIVTMYFGDIHADYDGRGIVFGSGANDNMIENCSVLNAASEGISISGNNHHLINCRVYADDNSTGAKSAMDYYIHVDGNENIVENCYVERVGNILHWGHGIDLKTNCENNLIINCVSKGMSDNGYELRHRGVRNNTLENCIAINCGFVIRDGASHNTIRNCKTIDAPSAIYFFDTSEDEGAQYAGRHNVIENCIFLNTQENAIDFFYYSQASIADSNTFMNCLFDGGNYLFNCDRKNNANKMVNCIVTNVQHYSRTANNQSGRYSLNFDFEYSVFWNNGFGSPGGENIYTIDPGFADMPNNDYHLTPESLCINAGNSVGAPLTDFDGNTRPIGDGVDIGPYEFTTPIYKNVYYVSTTGNDSADGSSIETAWRTITYAASSASPVSPGDSVFIEAGDYGNEYVVFETDGTITNKITFEGYQTVPGDNPDLEWEYGDSLNATIMPLLDGGDRTTGIGITLFSRENINLKNIQIRNYQVGLHAWHGHNLKIDNIVAMNFGDINDAYSGKGIVVGSGASNNTIENCSVLNACAEGISILGHNHYVRNCRVYADDNSTGIKSAMDYYIHIWGNDNIIENCHVERIGDIDHNGHGIDIKVGGENNLITNCVAKGMVYNGYELRHRGVQNNVLENCLAINCGFAIRDGASHNTLRNCKTTGAANGAILFYDTSEDDGAQYAGRHNVFENCIFQNSQGSVINFFYYSYPTLADSNTFVNCVFDGGDVLLNGDRENNANKMVNCIVTNMQEYYRTAHHQSVFYSLNFDFEYTVFWNNGFVYVPDGDSIYTVDPRFFDMPNNDYHLTAESPCINAGTSDGAPPFDFDGNKRPIGGKVDIGPYESSFIVGIDEYSRANVSSGNQLIIYPNPTSNQITIKGVIANPDELRVYNVLGQDVTHLIQSISINNTTATLNLTHLKPGVYFIKTGATINTVYKN